MICMRSQEVSRSIWWSFLLSFGLVAALIVQVTGCGGLGSNKIAPPEVIPKLAAEKALQQYDQNRDGVLSKEELDKCPGILYVMSDYDANQDGKVDGAELELHFETIYSSGVGLMSAGCTITRSGRPVYGAIVRFIPEEFLGGAIHTAEGTTDRYGFARIAVPDEKLPENQRGLKMAQAGIYQVEVETSPKEIVQNMQPMGVELNPTSRQAIAPSFDLAR